MTTTRARQLWCERCGVHPSPTEVQEGRVTKRSRSKRPVKFHVVNTVQGKMMCGPVKEMPYRKAAEE